MTGGPAAYSPYELLRALIERVGWPDTRQKEAALSSVDTWEQLAIFGNLAQMSACPHPEEAIAHYTRTWTGPKRYGWAGSDAAAVCMDCGKVNP